MTMNRPKKKRKMVPIYDFDDILAGKKNPKKIGRMSDPDAPGPVILDREAGNRQGSVHREGFEEAEMLASTEKIREIFSAM